MIQLPQTVDPAEAIAAVVGVRPLLTSTFERITAPMWDQIGGIEAKIYRLARDLARGKLDHAEFPVVDYDQFLDALSEEVDPAQIESIVAQFPLELHEVTTDYLGQTGKELRFLRGKFPISQVKTVFGAQNVPPSDTAVFAFEDVFEVVDRPLTVFEMVDSGRLTSDQALALMQLFPSLYKAIVTAIVQRVVLEGAAQGDDFDPHFGPGLAVLLAVPGVDPTLRQQLQAPKPQPQQPQKAPIPNGNAAAKRLATPDQKQELNDQ
jgi:hypothetical protein